jgi:hypothetical protein
MFPYGQLVNFTTMQQVRYPNVDMFTSKAALGADIAGGQLGPGNGLKVCDIKTHSLSTGRLFNCLFIVWTELLSSLSHSRR